MTRFCNNSEQYITDVNGHRTNHFGDNIICPNENETNNRPNHSFEHHQSHRHDFIERPYHKPVESEQFHDPINCEFFPHRRYDYTVSPTHIHQDIYRHPIHPQPVKPITPADEGCDVINPDMNYFLDAKGLEYLMVLLNRCIEQKINREGRYIISVSKINDKTLEFVFSDYTKRQFTLSEPTATATTEGVVRLSDAIDSNSSAADGVAATPKAVNDAIAAVTDDFEKADEDIIALIDQLRGKIPTIKIGRGLTQDADGTINVTDIDNCIISIEMKTGGYLEYTFEDGTKVQIDVLGNLPFAKTNGTRGGIVLWSDIVAIQTALAGQIDAAKTACNNSTAALQNTINGLNATIASLTTQLDALKTRVTALEENGSGGGSSGSSGEGSSGESGSWGETDASAGEGGSTGEGSGEP